MELDVSWTEERVEEPADLFMPHVWHRPHWVFDAAVAGEQTHPAGAIVGRGGPWRPLDGGQEIVALG